MAPPTIRTVATYNTHEDHAIHFFGNDLRVIVTSNDTVIRHCINNFKTFNSHPLVVGVGVQWTPSGYHSDSLPESYNDYADSPPRDVDPAADTLQLCVGKTCLIIQLSHCDVIPNELRSFLMDPETTFVGVWNSQDARRLAMSSHELEIGEILDLRKYVRDCRGRGMRGCSFEEIVDVCMGCPGVRLDPEVSVSDWNAQELSYEQILQASLDVFVCSQLGACHRIWEEREAMEEEEHEEYGGEMDGDMDMNAADGDAAREMDEMKKRLKEIEDEAAALREMQAKEEVDARSVFVGNVDYACTAEQVQQHFRSCGTVQRVTIRIDKFGEPKGSAYVEFVEAEAIQEALQLNESELHGRQLKVLPKRTNVPGMKQFRGTRFNRRPFMSLYLYSPYGYGKVPRFTRPMRYMPYQ